MKIDWIINLDSDSIYYEIPTTYTFLIVELNSVLLCELDKYMFTYSIWLALNMNFHRRNYKTLSFKAFQKPTMLFIPKVGPEPIP